MGVWEEQGKAEVLSTQPCGCDPGWVDGHAHHAGHVCGDYPHCAWGRYNNSHTHGGHGNEAPYIEAHFANLRGIHDSGKRLVFASGSMRDPSEGKIDWTRVTFGPLLRRWAQHLTTAEAKYPDPEPGVPNFSLIRTKEELIRYKKSAFRHFMSWYFDETDEDHAAAVCFNINGVEIIKAKMKGEATDNIPAPPPTSKGSSTLAYEDGE